MNPYCRAQVLKRPHEVLTGPGTIRGTELQRLHAESSA